jgi:hypothetical protein
VCIDVILCVLLVLLLVYSIHPTLIACILGPNIPLKPKGRPSLTLISFVPGKWSSVIAATLLAEQQRQTIFWIATGIPKQLL